MSNNAHELWLAQQHLVSVVAAAIAAFYLQCLSIIMANSQAASTVSQQWADHEIKTILLHFIKNRSEIGDAGNFKKTTYAAAARTIPGQTRSSSQVQMKWQAVSLVIVLFELIIHRSQLKSTYRAIQSYQDTSGVHWDFPENKQDIGRGANITSDAEAQVWQTMIDSKVHCYQIYL